MKMKDEGLHDLDCGLSMIHPAFLEIARKRVTAIERFLVGDRSSKSLRETAKIIDLSVSRTGRLIRSYEIHRDPSLVSGEGHRGDRQPASSRRAFIREAIQAAIQNLGTAAHTAEIEQAVAQACEKASITPPSIQLLWKALAKARRQNRAPATGVYPTTVIARFWFQLPVQSADGAIKRPEALVAMDLPSKRIRACLTDLRLGRIPRVTDLKKILSAGEPVRIGSIELGNLTEMEIGFPVQLDDGAQATLTRHLGNGIGQLEVLFRRPRTDARTLLNRGGGEALTIIEAEEIVRLALLRHESELEEARKGGVANRR